VKVTPDGGDFARPAGVPAPSVKSGNGATNSTVQWLPQERALHLCAAHKTRAPQSDRSSKTARLTHCSIRGSHAGGQIDRLPVNQMPSS
jgi:hypothetical protein